jgi:ATP-binding cassette subfamily B protein
MNPLAPWVPWAEAEWLERFRSLAADKTAIIISRGLSIAMLADTIHVINDGRIHEAGIYWELLARDTQYSWGWSLQTDATCGLGLLPIFFMFWAPPTWTAPACSESSAI